MKAEPALAVSKGVLRDHQPIAPKVAIVDTELVGVVNSQIAASVGVTPATVRS